MTAMNQAPTSPVPIQFNAGGGPCFGWFHAARGERRDAGIVLCPAMAWEALCGYRTFTQLAYALAGLGFDVVRFDYHGTGDAAGGDADPGRVPAWLDSIDGAIAQVKRLAGVSRIGLFGLRLGATLAAVAASRSGGVDALALWAVPPTGRAYVREIRAGAQRNPLIAASNPNDLLAMGSLYTEETLTALQALDCEKVPRAPAPSVLIIGRDDLPIEGPLPARYRALGATVAYEQWPGYAAMIDEPHKAQLDPDIVNRIANWFALSFPPLPAVREIAAPPLEPVEFVTDGVRERAMSFGVGQSLFGMLTESLQGPPHKDETGVILLNVAANYRVGPNRMYVKLARGLASAGYRVLRFDLPGIGDSRFEAGFTSETLYNKQSTAEVRAAIDLLMARGCKRIWLAGICSGSYVAFNTAHADPRVTGQILMNTRLLEWSASSAGSWQAAMTTAAYKSTSYYKQALFTTGVYARLLRGEINVRGIASRFGTLLGARVKRAFNRLLGRGKLEGVLPKMKELSARGTDTLVIMSSHDDGLDYMEFHLGERGSAMRGDPNFRFVMMDDTDHTFSPLASQRQVIQIVRDHLDSKIERADAHYAPLAPAVVAR